MVYKKFLHWSHVWRYGIHSHGVALLAIKAQRKAASVFLGPVNGLQFLIVFARPNENAIVTERE